jgi:hypothetical protein
VPIVRLGKDTTTVTLSVPIYANQTVTWTPLDGPAAKFVDRVPDKFEAADRAREATRELSLTSDQSGYYTYEVTVRAGDRSEQGRLSFLAVPELHADHRFTDAKAQRNEPYLLDATGSYDVLNDTLAFSWVVQCKVQSDGSCAPTRAARVVDSHAVLARFIASESGKYRLRLYVRANRKLGTAVIPDVVHKEFDVTVEECDVHAFLDWYTSNHTTDLYRLGVMWNPALSSFSTVARSFSFRRMAGVAVSLERLDGESSLFPEGMVGFGVRIHQRVDISGMIRFYRRATFNKAWTLAASPGVTLGVRFASPLWGWLGPLRNKAYWFEVKARYGPATRARSPTDDENVRETGFGVAVEF